jgi:hypothetical protein
LFSIYRESYSRLCDQGFSLMARDAVIVEAVRTAVGKRGGGLARGRCPGSSSARIYADKSIKIESEPN